MENSKSPPHTRTSTSASALIAEPTEELIRRTGIQVAVLLNIVAIFTRSPAISQLLEQIAPDSLSFFPPIQASDMSVVGTPTTLGERIDTVKKALLETRPEEGISLRAFVHLMADDLRAAHPRLSWGEIAEILKKVGFDGATADSVRQAVKSAPPAPPKGVTPLPPVPPEGVTPVSPSSSLPPSTRPVSGAQEHSEDFSSEMEGPNPMQRQRDGLSDARPQTVLHRDAHPGHTPEPAVKMPDARPVLDALAAMVDRPALYSPPASRPDPTPPALPENSQSTAAVRRQIEQPAAPLNQGRPSTPPAPDDDEYDAFAPETWRPRPRP